MGRFVKFGLGAAGVLTASFAVRAGWPAAIAPAHSEGATRSSSAGRRTFLAIAFGMARVLQGFRRLRGGVQLLEVASGRLLMGIGAIVLLGRFTWLSSQLAFLNRSA